MAFGSSPFGAGPFGGGLPSTPDELRALPTILLHAIVEAPDRDMDGAIIASVGPAWQMLLDLLARDPDEIYKIPHRKMEELIAASYERSGFDRVVLTPQSGDLGRDVVAEKNGAFTVRFVDQVKAYRPGHLVTAEEVRALGFVAIAEKARGVVTTTSDFAPRLADDRLIKPYLDERRIELVNGAALLEKLRSLRAADTGGHDPDSNNSE